MSLARLAPLSLALLPAIVGACSDLCVPTSPSTTMCLSFDGTVSEITGGSAAPFNVFAPSYNGDPCVDFVPTSFDFPRDELACDGDQFVRFDDRYGLFVGLVRCDADVIRLYLSDDGATFLPATDTAGHGQDQCELVHPGFTLGNEDGIESGNCPSCTTSTNLPLEGVDTWTRANFGEGFVRERSSEWSWQTSQLGCGVDLGACDVDGDVLVE